MKQKTIRWLFLLAAVLLCAGGGLFLWRSGFFQAAASQESLRAYIQQFSPYSHLCFFLVQLLSVVLAPIPSNITALAGGVLFGTWPSFLMTFAAVALGSVLVFTLARGLGREAVNRLVGRKVSEKYREVIQAKTDVFLVLAFLFPFSPTMCCASWRGSPTSRWAASRSLCCLPGPGACWWPAPWGAPPSPCPGGGWSSSA